MINDTDNSKRQIKFHITADEHRIIRLAAALGDTTMAEFCRDVVLRESQDVTKNIKLPRRNSNVGKSTH